MFLRMIEYQGGHAKTIERGKPVKPAAKVIRAKAGRAGYVKSIDTYRLGRLIIEMGGGRTVAGQPIDHSTGFVIQAKIGDKIEKDDVILDIHAGNKLSDDYLYRAFTDCIEIVDQEVRSPKLMLSQCS